MVSVPDWTKFSQLTETKQTESNSQRSKFYKQREAEAVKQAEEYGYFLNPSEGSLKLQCGDLNPGVSNVFDYRLINLTGVHVRILGDVTACTRLTICLLANNFLTKCDALISCQNLIRLDLHSNQLTSIPKGFFWCTLRKLQMLHLHDNPLGKFETVKILGSSPNLNILTLYDTPLSLKKNYRHHVVNSIWTLKALDSHVISDEEIIEDAVFGSRFAPLSPPFRIDLCPQTPSNFTFAQEMCVMGVINARANAILAKYSPVLIIQRCMRGYLTRKRLGISSLRDITKSNEMAWPPPITPISLGRLGGESYSMDYDTYMKHRRPGSIVPEELDGDLSHRGSEPGQQPKQKRAKEKQQHLHINLEKLELGMLSGLLASNAVMEKAMKGREGLEFASTSRREKPRRKDKDAKDETLKPKRLKDIRSFFGPVKLLNVEKDEEDSDGEIPITEFRLNGTKPNLLVVDATTEMILSRQEAGHMVREAEMDRVKMEAAKPLPKVVPFKFTTTDQRIFNRSQGTMGLSCLMAVHKAYKEREKAEKAAAKMENILGMREERQRAKDRINLYLDGRRAQVLKARDLDRARTIDTMEKKELQRLNFLDKHQEHKMRNTDGSKALRVEHSFMLEFNAQHTSVSNALLRHDRQAKQKDVQSMKQTQISKSQMTVNEQQDTVKKYLEHRQLMRQTETAMAKATLDTKMLTEANERVMDARSRVAQLKAKRASIQAFYPLPPNTLPPTSTVLPGLSRWEARVSASAGHVGRHHTIYV